MRFFLSRFWIFIVLIFSLHGCQQSPVGFLPVSEAEIVVTPALLKVVNQGSAAQCSTKLNSEDPLFTLHCTHYALQQPVTDQEQFRRLFSAQQTALQQLVLHHLVDGEWHVEGKGYRLRLDLPTDEHGMRFTRYTPVQQLQFADPAYQPVLQDPAAIGIALVAERPHSKNAFDQYYPREGIFRSVTVTLNEITVDEQHQLQIKLKGHYLTAPEQVEVAGRHVMLSYDPASATLLLLRDARIDQSAFSALLDGNKPGYDYGIFSPGPIRADRRPILMIHGLNSSPMIWLKLSHAIYRDPELSAHYQVWHAFYPSGAPPFFNAMRLRHDVDQLRKQLQQSAGLSIQLPMVVIGHSMGGIIAKTFIINSGMALWDETFLFRPEAWPGKDKDLERYRDVFLFNARKDVDSVFFLDTPHHGAEIAEAWYSRLASKLITIPEMFARLNRKLFQRIRIETVTPQMQPYLQANGPNSVQVLSPQHPLLQKIATLPYQRPVYSVVGSDDKPYCYDEKSCAQLSDSVVPFFSAHEPRAEVQIIVPSQHNSYQSPEAIAFILQQLRQRLNAGERH